MPTDALGHTHVRLDVAGIQESKVTTRVTSIKNIEEQIGFKKHAECSNPNKSGWACMYYLSAIYSPGQNDNGYKGNDAIYIPMYGCMLLEFE